MVDLVPLPKSSRLWKSKADFFRPFRTASAADAGENITPLYDPNLYHDYEEEPNLKELNHALRVLVEVFPNVEPEVFREMLLNVSPESRVEIVTETLLRNASKGMQDQIRKRQKEPGRPEVDDATLLRAEDTFRSEAYRDAVKQVFYQEFRGLSHSSIKGVLAERNYSYTLARPILQQLKARSWRYSLLPSLWPRSSTSQAVKEHPFIVRKIEGGAEDDLGVKKTGSAQLDQELYELFVEPVLRKLKQGQLASDYEYASHINDMEAAEAEALFDCECCYSSVPFEQIAVCDDNCHQLCFDCIRRTVNEAIYGQGWTRAADLDRSTLRCFAQADCDGFISTYQVCRALSDGAGSGDDTWNTFQSRLTRDVLLKSNMKFLLCPFCEYAELDEQEPSMAYLLPVVLLCLSWILSVLCLFFPLHQMLSDSWSRVKIRRRGLKFHCRNPPCAKTSCIRCSALWRDPHACFESEQTSLRTAIESSATAAIKRTCPKCLLSFVKSSGCNKLVCNCGYTMCYVCRQEITNKEGYSHFCQHFRPNAGRCRECERCDLYGDEDEEKAIRRAVEAAEREWRDKEGQKGEDGASAAMVQALVEQARRTEWYEPWLDALVDAIAA